MSSVPLFVLLRKPSPLAVIVRGLILCWLRLPVLLLRWWRKLGSRLSLWVLSASPAPAGLPMIAGCRTQ